MTFYRSNGPGPVTCDRLARRWSISWTCCFLLLSVSRVEASGLASPEDFTDRYCTSCHDDVEKKGGLDLGSLTYQPNDPTNLQTWIKVHDRLAAGEMPPKEKRRPNPERVAAFIDEIATTVTGFEQEGTARDGRAMRRRLNSYEYEYALQDLLHAPWLQIRGQFPTDGEAYRFNKVGAALDVSHVHMSRYISAADYAMRQVLTVKLERPPTAVQRHYARDQRTLTSLFTANIFNSSPDRMTYPVNGREPQPEVRARKAPVTVGAADPALRDQEAVGWVSSNYVTGFSYRWDGFRAPVAGRYRVRFSGYTLWAAPGGVQMKFANEADKVGTPRLPDPNTPDFDQLSPGRRNEPITVYTRGGLMNRRVGEFDVTPEPAVYDLGEVWLLANETLVPDASRFYRSRPDKFVNPLMQMDGVPSVAFRWMEIEGPLYDQETDAGYRLLFGDLPLRRVPQGHSGGVSVSVVAPRVELEPGRLAGRRIPPMQDVAVEVVSSDPMKDGPRLIQSFMDHALRRPAAPTEVKRIIALFADRLEAGLSFTEAMLASYTAVLASPAFVYLEETPGPLTDYALATRLSLFLWNSAPDDTLRAHAACGELRTPDVLRAETERLLSDPKARRFIHAFLDYWIDARKMEDTTPSTTLYNDYYLDDALTEAALAETQLFFEDLVGKNRPARLVVDSDYTFLNERLAVHYGIPDVKGIQMRKVHLAEDSPRGGFMTQATVLKVTANGTTTSPVLRGNWIVERILGIQIPPPPPVGSVEPDIRGAVTIRQQLEKHRADASCAACHSKMDPPGFALESFDILGGWRDRYRAADEKVPSEPGRGKNGHAFVFHYALPVDAAGALPDGRPFGDVREFKRLLRNSEVQIARNLARQLTIYATGAPIRFSDRPHIEQILHDAEASQYGVRSLIHGIVQSPLFLNK
ncbi:MAG: DUF1592 domain-containing protein [Opitutus sp.]